MWIFFFLVLTNQIFARKALQTDTYHWFWNDLKPGKHQQFYKGFVGRDYEMKASSGELQNLNKDKVVHFLSFHSNPNRSQPNALPISLILYSTEKSMKQDVEVYICSKLANVVSHFAGKSSWFWFWTKKSPTSCRWLQSGVNIDNMVERLNLLWCSCSCCLKSCNSNKQMCCKVSLKQQPFLLDLNAATQQKE